MPPRWAAVLTLLHAARIPPLCDSSSASSTTCPTSCTTWFDGCENCACTHGRVGVCTFNPTCIAPGRAYCKSHGTPRHATLEPGLPTPVPTPSRAENSQSRGRRTCCSPTDTSCCGPAALPPADVSTTTQATTHEAAQSGPVPRASAPHVSAPRDKHVYAACDGLIGSALAARLSHITHSFEVCMMKANFGKGAGGGGGQVSAVCSCITDIDAHLAHFGTCPQAQHELGQIALHARGLCSKTPAPTPMPTSKPALGRFPVGGTNAPHPVSALRAAQHRDEMKRLGDISRQRQKAHASRAAQVHVRRQIPKRRAHSASASPKQSCPKKCVRWFDGCNACECEGGEVGLCVFNPKCFGAGGGTGVPHCMCFLGQPCAKAFVKQGNKVEKAPRHSMAHTSKLHPHISNEKAHKQKVHDATARAHKEADFKSAKLRQQRKHEKASKEQQRAQEKILKKQKAVERHTKATSRRRAPTVAPTLYPTPTPTPDPEKVAQLKKLEATLAEMKRQQSDKAGMNRADNAARVKLARLHKMEATLIHLKQARKEAAGATAGATAGVEGTIALMHNMQQSTSPAQLRARLLALRKRMGLLGRVPQSPSEGKLVIQPAHSHGKDAGDTTARSGRLRISADAAGIGGSTDTGDDSTSLPHVRTHVDTGASAFNEANALFHRLQQEAEHDTKNTAVHALVLLRAVHIGFGGAGAARFPVAIAAAIDAACGQRLQSQQLSQRGGRRRLHVFRIPGAGVTMGAAKCDTLARTAVRVQQTRRVPILGQTALHFLQVRFELLAQNSGDASTIVALMQQPGGTFASELTAQLKMLWPQFAMSYRPIANGAGGQSPDVIMQAAAVGLPEQVVQQKVRWAKLAQKKRGKLAAAKAATTHVVPDDKHQKVTQGRSASPPSKTVLLWRLVVVGALVGACVMAIRGNSASAAARSIDHSECEPDVAAAGATLNTVATGDNCSGSYGGVDNDFSRENSADSGCATAVLAETATATCDPANGGASAAHTSTLLGIATSRLTSAIRGLYTSRLRLPAQVPATAKLPVRAQQQQKHATSASELVPVRKTEVTLQAGENNAADSSEPTELAVVRRAIDAAVQAEAYEEAALLKRRLELLRLSANNRLEQAALRAKIDAAVAREEYAAAAAFKPELDALRQRDAQIRLQAQSVGSGTPKATGPAPLPASTHAVLPSHSASIPSNFDDDDEL